MAKIDELRDALDKGFTLVQKDDAPAADLTAADHLVQEGFAEASEWEHIDGDDTPARRTITKKL